MKKIYFDGSATTAVFPEAVQAMVQCMNSDFGNPSSSHSFGRKAKKLIENARCQVAGLINAKPDEIFFTSGGTEADNLAILGVASRYEKGHIITTSIEHHAVLKCCEYLETKGFDVTYLKVDTEGSIDLSELRESIRSDTILISVMHGNNEVGTIQPIELIGKIAQDNGIIFHVDAVQSLGKIEVDVSKINCDLLTCSSHKINGPKGVGALYIKYNTPISGIILGGGQENNIRSGTENVPGIVGFGKAAEITAEKWRINAQHTKKLRDYFINRLENEFDNVKINGSQSYRLPHNINFSFNDTDGVSLMLLLDNDGIAVSTGSACNSSNVNASHVLTAIGLPDDWLRCSIRVTLGYNNTKDEIDYLIDRLKINRKLLIEAERLFNN